MNRPAPPKKIKKLKSLYSQGNFSEAVSFAEDLIKRHKTPYLLWYLYGVASVRTGQLEQAEKALLTAAKLNKSMPDIPYLLANVRKMRGNIEGALKSFERTLQLAPRSADAHIQIGTIRGQRGQFEEAISSYNRALEISPDHAEVYNNRGVFQKELGDFEGAAESYQNAIRLKPDYVDAHFNLGNLQADEAKLREAAASYKCALQIEPTLAKARNALGAVFYEEGKLSDALACYVKVFETEPLYVKTIKNLVRFPTQVLPNATIDELAAKIGLLSDADISNADKAFVLANIQRLRENMPEAFNLFCGANQIKGSDLESRSHFDAQQRANVLSEFQKWSPQTKPASGGIKTLFILGPSRSGKSTLERLLGRTPSVTCALEKCRIYGKHEAAWQEKTEALKSSTSNRLELNDIFFLSGDRHSTSPIKVITCTHPGIIHCIPEIHEHLPGARFCMVKRNTIDLAAEIFVSNYTADNPYAYAPSSILQYIEWYNAMWDAASSKIGGMTIAYEDMIHATRETIRDVGQFLNQSLGLPEHEFLTLEAKSTFHDLFKDVFSQELQKHRQG